MKVKAIPFTKQLARLVVYSDINSQQIQAATAKLKYVIQEMATEENTATNTVSSCTTNSHNQKDTFYVDWEPLLYNLCKFICISDTKYRE